MTLRVYEDAVGMVGAIGEFARRVERRDPDLARQMRRAAASVVLNLSEGLHSQGRNREARLHTSMGSARESLASLDVAVALGYMCERDVSSERDRIDRIVAILWRLIHR